jgi:hypothetical protein
MASMIVELLHGLHQAEVALLDEVQEGHPMAQISLGYTNHQPGVGFDEMLASLFTPLDFPPQPLPFLRVMAVSSKASPGHPPIFHLPSQFRFLLRG